MVHELGFEEYMVDADFYAAMITSYKTRIVIAIIAIAAISGTFILFSFTQYTQKHVTQVQVYFF
jgi:hypothetical protein